VGRVAVPVVLAGLFLVEIEAQLRATGADVGVL
jgi:hypothetical protein